jgi:hypothetical protein
MTRVLPVRREGLMSINFQKILEVGLDVSKVLKSG